jgi:hypothetical protein
MLQEANVPKPYTNWRGGFVAVWAQASDKEQGVCTNGDQLPLSSQVSGLDPDAGAGGDAELESLGDGRSVWCDDGQRTREQQLLRADPAE